MARFEDEEILTPPLPVEERVGSLEDTLDGVQQSQENLRDEMQAISGSLASIRSLLEQQDFRRERKRKRKEDRAESKAKKATRDETPSSQTLRSRLMETPFPQGVGPVPSPLENRISAAPPVGVPAVPTLKGREAKLKDPKPYNGDQKKRPLEDFLADVIDVFRCNPLSFSSDQVKITYVATLLQDKPKQWYRQITHFPVEHWPPYLSNWDLFVEQLQFSYGDRDPIDTRTQEWIDLKQTTSASAYRADWEARAYTLGVRDFYGSAVSAQQFFKGLKKRVRDYINQHEDKPHTYRELADLAVRIDNRLTRAYKAEEAEKRQSGSEGNKSGKPSNRGFKHKGSSGKRTAPSDEENDTGTSKEGRKRFRRQSRREKDKRPKKSGKDAAAELRKERFTKGLCIECGESGHIARNCPSRGSSEKTNNKEDKDKSSGARVGPAASSKNPKA